MNYSIKNVVDASSMLGYCAANLGWGTGSFEFEDIDDITYDFTASDLGLQEEAFAKIQDFRQLRPIVDDQPYGIFFISFENKSLNISALRRILQRLTPSKYGREYKTWRSDRIIFFCFWGTLERRSIGFAKFENPEEGLYSVLKIFYCTPSAEDASTLSNFENKLARLRWPTDSSNHDTWSQKWNDAFAVDDKKIITDTRRLVDVLVSVATRIREDILSSLKAEETNGNLHLLWKELQIILGDIYTKSYFAGMFAQAIVYGFLTARCVSYKQNKQFSFKSALSYLPLTNPFLKSIIETCCRPDNIMTIDLSLLDELVAILNATKIEEIVGEFNRQTSMGRTTEDPIVSFYEEFINGYDPEQRKIMGEYFTPFPAADFMVRAVESLLKKEFDIPSGVLDNQVSILDPGAGTATCIRDLILRAHREFRKNHKQEDWSKFVESSLLKRISGFELMMAPYAIAHLKIALALQETGYILTAPKRIGIYLKNSLRPYIPTLNKKAHSKLAEIVDEEALNASRIFKGDVQVIIGGPPFREDSWNKEKWISELLSSYKKEPNSEKRLEEKNLRPLSNDYVKFIRYAQELVKDSNHAIIAFVLPHTYIDNLTFRGMRWELLNEFSDIYILDLHGNALGQGKAADQNIFEIQQGICISIFVKKPKIEKQLATVQYAEVVGTRTEKFNFLKSKDIQDIKWEALKPTFPSFFMSPRGMVKKSAHIKWINLARLFPVSKVGVKTHNDEELISTSKFDTPFDQLYAYRPFDTRHINYDRTKVERDRYEVTQHFIGHKNIGIVIDRQVMADNWSHFQVVEHMIDNRLHYSRKGNPYLCPVYLFDNNGRRSLNLDRKIIHELEISTSLVFSEIETDNPEMFDVLDVVDYAYGVLFCNVFRHKFAATLSLDFPSIPLPSSRKAFRAFSEQGKKLRNLHAYGAKVPNDLAIVYTGTPNSIIKNYKWGQNRAYVNKDCFLSPVPEQVWNYCFGGYRGLQKWLKDRNGKVLTSLDIEHMINVFNIIDKSIEISKFIDILAFKYFNGFEDDSVSIDVSYRLKNAKEEEYTIAPEQTEWRDAAHRPTSGFRAD